MIKKLFFFLLTFSVSSLFGQKTFSPEKIDIFDPIPVVKPIILDSTNSSNQAYSENMLLTSKISIPNQSEFKKELKPDSSGLFHFLKPEKGYAFNLISFYVNGDGYGTGNLNVTSTARFELYVDNRSCGSQTSVSDSISKANPVKTSLKGITNSSRVVVKMLSAASDKTNPVLKIELKTEKTDSLLKFTFADKEKRRLRITDMILGKRISGAKISPSGRFALLINTDTQKEAKTSYNIEVYDIKQRKMVLANLTYLPQLSWLPNKDLLYYVSDSDNGKKLCTLDPLTSETGIVAENIPGESFTISPDGKSLLYLVKETPSISNPAGLKRLLGPDDRQSSYRHRYNIYRYFFDSGLTQQLTFGKKRAYINDISNDSKYLLFSVSTENLTERPFSLGSTYVMNLESMTVDTLWHNKPFFSSSSFSPDGKKIVIDAMGDAFDGIGLKIKSDQISNSFDKQSFIMDLATKKVTAITKEFDPSIDKHIWNSDNNIFYTVQEGSHVSVFRYSLTSGKFEKLPMKEEIIRQFDVSKDGKYAVYTGVSNSNSTRCYLLNLKSMQSTLLTDPYAESLAKLDLGEVKDWRFTSKSGDEIDGFYYLPPNFDPAKKYPLIVYYYGGTMPTQRIFESTFPLHLYAAYGNVVYALNPSGTTGYGQEFAARHVNAWGKQTADEIIEGTEKFIKTHSFVDGTKIANIGASYGGFMTQYLATRTDLFTTSISHAGISDISGYWGGGYWGYSYSTVASADSYPWNNSEMYVKQSPLYNADKIKTPLLLLHGTADTNVPPQQSMELYTALKLQGKTVEFIQVEGENHVIMNYKKRIEWNDAIQAWLTKWLKNDSRWWDSMFPSK